MVNFNLDKYNTSLKTDYVGRNLVYLKETESTNDFASKLINKREKNCINNRLKGTVILAEIQKKGKGRFERKWISPAGGLWFTIIIFKYILQSSI